MKEKIILSAVVRNQAFCMQALPFLKLEYFSDNVDKDVFKAIVYYFDKYATAPTKTALEYEVLKHVKQDEIKTSYQAYIDSMFQMDLPVLDWLVSEAEKFCQEKAAYNAIMKAIEIYNGDEKAIKPDAIPDLLRDAVSIQFEIKIGHDFLEDAEQRFDYYTNPISRIPFSIDVLNQVTSGGVPRKTLNILLAGVNCGKTGFMCHLAANYIQQGFNVLYITLEMAEEEIGRRIDANVLNIPMHELTKVNKDRYMTAVEKIRAKGYGKLIIKQFEAGVGHAGHFRYLLRELASKQGVNIDVIIVDYIGICASQKVSHSSVNTYSYQKFVAEELRNLAIAYDAICWTGMQLNRKGYDAKDVEMTDVADSFAVAAAADYVLSLTRTDELDEVNKVLCKQIKSRYGNKSDLTKFLIGVNQDLQQYYDTDNPHLAKTEVKASQQQEADPEATIRGFQRGNTTAGRFAQLE